jgi:hypothetical protein
VKRPKHPDPRFKAHLRQGVQALRYAQDGIVRLMAEGATEAEIRKHMLSFGFGDITVEQFLKVKTAQEVIKLLEGATRFDEN